jgi:hypothetical protein
MTAAPTPKTNHELISGSRLPVCFSTLPTIIATRSREVASVGKASKAPLSLQMGFSRTFLAWCPREHRRRLRAGSV